jgi:hypothetical protein
MADHVMTTVPSSVALTNALLARNLFNAVALSITTGATAGHTDDEVTPALAAIHGAICARFGHDRMLTCNATNAKWMWSRM